MRFRSANRQAVYDALKSGGLPAAIEVGTKLGIKERRIIRWSNKWSAAPATGVKRAQVTLTWDPERRGVVLGQGPEQSEVRWDNGRTQIHSNKDLLSV